MAPQHEHWISSEEYLQIDRASLNVKYEYEDGHMYAMSGGTVEHAQIAMNMVRALADHLQSGPCRVFSSDVRVQVAEKNIITPMLPSVVIQKIGKEALTLSAHRVLL